jgi:hypothetical protein
MVANQLSWFYQDNSQNFMVIWRQRNPWEHGQGVIQSAKLLSNHYGDIRKEFWRKLSA